MTSDVHISNMCESDEAIQHSNETGVIYDFLHFTTYHNNVLHSVKVTLKMVMSFSTGADAVPPMGYCHDPEINFNDMAFYPTSSTCALQLTLPTRHSEYRFFKSALDTAFTIHGGFGLS